MLRTTLLVAVVVIVVATPAVAQSSRAVPLYDNLGTLHHEISTSVPLAQRHFGQGLRLTYGFNHAEAIAAYRQAAALGPWSASALVAAGAEPAFQRRNPDGDLSWELR